MRQFEIDFPEEKKAEVADDGSTLTPQTTAAAGMKIDAQSHRGDSRSKYMQRHGEGDSLAR